MDGVFLGDAVVDGGKGVQELVAGNGRVCKPGTQGEKGRSCFAETRWQCSSSGIRRM